jgi:hypothetical protein
MNLIHNTIKNKKLFSFNKCNLLDVINNKKERIYNYEYDDNGNYFTIKTNEINSYTFIELYNLHQSTQIAYLDSYLYFFRKYHNSIVLHKPDLKKIYDELSYENILRNNNKFIIYGLNINNSYRKSDINNWFFH